MTALFFLLGVLLPACFGWVLVRTAEASTPVLERSERLAWGLVLGPTSMTMLTLLLERLHVVRFTLTGFLLPMLVLGGGLALLLWKRGRLTSPAVIRFAPAVPRTKVLRLLTMALIAWTAVKLAAGAFDVFTVPTYWDDSFNNWNLRGKIFYETKAFTLTIQNGNGIVQDAQGVSSYPPALPLIKTWMSALRGQWSEPLINGVHLTWILGLLAAVYFTLRRRTDATVSALGTCAVLSLPLLLLHAFNPYAEVFLASHLFLVIANLLEAGDAPDAQTLRTRLRLLALTFGLLLFTKNEATVLYAPLLVLATLWVLWRRDKANAMPRSELLGTVGQCLGIAAVLVLPWLVYKWTHGLTFGNAKAVSGFTFAFNGLAFDAIAFQLSHEPNFLILPLALPFLLAARWKQAFTDPLLPVTAFVLAALLLQIGVFICVPSLANEAILQTGLNRGMIHLAPIAILLVTLLADRSLRESA